MGYGSFLKPEITELIEKKEWDQLKIAFSDWPAPDFPDLLLELDKPKRLLLYRSLPRRLASEVFSHTWTPL